MPKITENPEVQSHDFVRSIIFLFLLFSASIVLFLYCSLPLLSHFPFVSTDYCLVSHNREYRSTHAIVLPLIVPTLIVLPFYYTRLLYCP